MFYNSLRKGQKLLLVLIVLLSCNIVFSQVVISGPKCVLNSLIYQYEIKGDWKENEKISICVDGGVLSETGTTCIERQSVAFVRVQWSDGKTTGKITVKCEASTTNLNVSITPPFNPGFIETTDKQIIAYNKLSPALNCTQASGGNCAPSFSYQWEQSINKVQWTTISGSTGRNLSFATPLKQTTFFRRRVYESKSQTIGYTNAIAVYVTPEAKKK